MINALFKKSILISALWHFTVFSLFSFSSGNRLPRLGYPPVSFLGGVFGNYALTSTPLNVSGIKKIFSKANTIFLDRNRQVPLVSQYYVKPQVNPVFSEYKKVKLEPATPAFMKLPKKESVIMFYPPLPYHFLLYFKDRQTVHIELAFNIISNAGTNSIVLKRKISSGNLEADLLTMRYLSHYLFIQQVGLPVNTWQSVKIELSPKND